MLVKEIKDFFEKYKLALTKPGQFLSRKERSAIEELKLIATKFSKETRIPVYICCQNSINDSLILLQKYYKDHKKELNDKSDNKNGDK